MKKFQDFLEKAIAPIATTLGNNTCIKAITQGMMLTVAFTIVGSIFTILGAIPIDVWTKFITDTGLKDLFAVMTTVTIDIIALIATFGIAYSYAEMKKEEGRAAGLLAVISFLILIPLEVTAGEISEKAIPFTNLGGRGLFLAIIVGLLTGFVFTFVKKKGWVIKMPAGVPENIGSIFSAVIPVFIMMFLVWLVRGGMSYTSYGDVNSMIYKFIQAPLANVMSNAYSSIILTVLNSIFWFFGIHSMAINQLVSPAMRVLDLANLELFNAGLAPTNISTWNFFMMTAKLGGTGCTLGLCVYLAFFSKSKRYRMLGKLALPAVIFNVNEPLIFGLPILLNPLLLIPFFLAPIVAYLLAYLVTWIGLLTPIIGLQLPVEFPVLLSGLLQGGVGFMILQFVIAIISCLIYYPFINIMDKQAVEEEAAATKEESITRSEDLGLEGETN
jgi:PTS system cellobiose-specific IIC component